MLIENVPVAIVMSLIIGACTIYIGKGIYDVFANYQRPKVTKGPNDDDDAKCYIKEVIGAAENRVEIFDDGDKVQDGESVYDDEEFLTLVGNKLDGGVQFRCLFNSDNPKMAFRSRFDSDSRIDIRVRKTDSPATSTIHYRNVDAGSMIYLTDHMPHSKDRRFKMIDARHMSDEYRQSLDENLDEWRQDEAQFRKVGNFVAT